ncbi:hypothetical protein ACFQU3_19950 [Terrabacter sp. GCM10028922]|uniref:hypothetical protein n=1 Tax=Terrabacter sp. GCM10028922 TaxID=3273428 RepID=UPI003622591F
MSDAYPVNETARERLRAAQKSESDALRAVSAAERLRDKARDRLELAEAALSRAQVALVNVSGVRRTERLIGESATALRQKAREAGLKPSQLE